MRHSVSAALLAASSIVACRTSISQATPAVVALTHVTVIDGTGTSPRPDMTILIDAGRIVRVQPSSVPLPPTTVERNLAGRFVIPGLIEAHVHLGTQPRPPAVMEAILRASLLGGVTSVRDMGGQFELVDRYARLGQRDSAAVPRVLFAAIVAGPGMWLEGERSRFFAGASEIGASPSVRRLRDSADVVPAVTAAKRAGAAGIKIYNTIAPSLVRAVAAEAHRQGLHVWSHLYVDPGAPSSLIDAGAEVVSHADMFVAEVVSAAAREGTIDAYRAARQVAYADMALITRPPVQRLIALMKERRVIFDPTLFIMRPGLDSMGRVDPRHGALFHAAVLFTRAVHRAGVDIAAGTDALGGSTPNLHTELQLLVDSVGMTPLEAIRAATLVGARALGIAETTGTIEAGKRADLVVLAGDPSIDIANTTTVIGVMKAGHYHERARAMPTPPGARAPRPPG